jgi:chemotaxis-related protein WspD
MSDDPARPCWTRIGHEGDKSCPNLEGFIHCRACPVYTDAGLRLFDREPPEGYLEEWTHALAAESRDATEGTQCVAVLRIGAEHLGLSPACIRGLYPPRLVRPVPHRSGASFAGVTVLQGEVVPVISVRTLLGAAEAPQEMGQRKAFARFILAEPVRSRGSDLSEPYAFAVDEALGLSRFPSSAVEPSPSTVLRSPATYTRGIVSLGGVRVSLLDEELFFTALRRAIS